MGGRPLTCTTGQTRLDGPLWVKQPGASLGRAAGDSALCTAQPDEPIWRSLQQQEECPVSLVIGRVSAAFRAPHDHIPCGRAHAPSPSSAALVQKQFKNRKFIRHHGRDLIGFLCKKVSENFKKSLRQFTSLSRWSQPRVIPSR